jgi:hypothetical protein
MLLWEIIFLVIIIKIPLVYFGGVMWWSIKSEPELQADEGGDGAAVMRWMRRPPKPGRPARGSRCGSGVRGGARSVRRRERSRAA